LDASLNEITKIENLDNMISLTYLNLGFNLIRSLENLGTKLGNVTTLILRNNQISDITVCSHFSNDTFALKKTKGKEEGKRVNTLWKKNHNSIIIQ